MKERNIVPIVFNIDNDYFTALVVTIISMLTHKKKSTFYDVYIMMNEEIFLFKENLKKLEEDYKEDIQINYIDMKDFGSYFHKGHLNISVYYRCFIHDYIKHYDNIIYSDVDIIILDDLYDIYTTDLKNNCLGVINLQLVNIAAKNKNHIHHIWAKRDFFDEIIDVGNHFCGGFLLMNLKKIREGNYTSYIIKSIENKPIILDQTVLNQVFHKKVINIHPKYSYFPDSVFWDELNKADLLEIHTQQEIEEYETNPSIIHYISNKPWKLDNAYGHKLKQLKKKYYLMWYDYYYKGLQYIPKKEIFKCYKNYYVEVNNYLEKNDLIIENSKLINEKNDLIIENSKLISEKDDLVIENSRLINDQWYKFGQSSRMLKIKAIGKILSKKLKIYGIMRSVYKIFKFLF